jgi:hypothetical protein
VQLETLDVPALVLLLVASTILTLNLEWRLSIIALGVQYLGIFILVGISWPLEMAAVKLIAGWIAGAVLGMALVSNPPDMLRGETHQMSERLFRIFLAVLVGFAILSFAPQVAKWMLQASYEQIIGGLLLIGMGIFYLGLSDLAFRVAIGILTFLSGFEILYATLERSPLTAGFLAVLTLSIALISSYLMSISNDEAEE